MWAFFLRLVVWLFLSCLVLAGCHPIDDEVDYVPGYGKPPTKWYSGYLNTTIEEKKDITLSYHYLLIESETNPDTDPLLLWTNGGPGASSLWGFFTEIGPLWLTEDSLKTADFNATGVPSLFWNEYGWNKNANLLILSGPPPVSLGFCDPPGPSGSALDCREWNDSTTAKANFGFLEAFFAKYPSFSENQQDFYLSGESYAGIYIPTLTQQILAHPDSVPASLLKGIAIGDGCIGKDLVCGLDEPTILETLFSLQFLYGHGQVSTASYKKSYDTCINLIGSAGANKKPCLDQYKSVLTQVGGFFQYDLYDECWDVPDMPNYGARRDLPRYEQYPCGGGVALQKYVESCEFRSAFHIPEETEFFSGDNGDGFDYVSTETDLRGFYKKIVKDGKMRVLIYNGDADPVLNSFFSEWWVNSLKLEKIEGEVFRPWTLDGKKKVVGYVTRFEGDFDYLTIRGSGHMVPQMKPAAAYEMISNWLSQENWKPFKP